MLRRSFLLIMCLALAGCEKPLAPVSDANKLRDGSVLFWDHGPLEGPIYRRTNSTLTHAAVILYVGDEPWLYEATWPCVRRIPLSAYVLEMEMKRERRPVFSWFIMQPRERYTEAQLLAMKRHADSQLGRRYMMRGWWKNREVRGIMCSQFAADVLEKSGCIISAHYRESPGSLHEKLMPLYR